jgi:hypothetical protein
LVGAKQSSWRLPPVPDPVPWLLSKVRAAENPWVRGFLVILLVLVCVWGAIALVLNSIGQAAILTDLHKPDTTASKVTAALVEHLVPWSWPWPLTFILVLLCVIFIGLAVLLPSRDHSAPIPRASAALAEPGGWARIAPLGPHGIPGATTLHVPKEEPVQIIEIALGNFQDVSWGGAKLRLTFAEQYSNEEGGLAAQVKVEMALGLLGSQSVQNGPSVDSMGHGYFRLPTGAPETAGARSVYWHYMPPGSYYAFALFVGHLNPQNGLVRLTGLFAEYHPDLTKMLEAMYTKHE